LDSEEKIILVAAPILNAINRWIRSLTVELGSGQTLKAKVYDVAPIPPMDAFKLSLNLELPKSSVFLEFVLNDSEGEELSRMPI
jgi:hypothetical protein